MSETFIINDIHLKVAPSDIDVVQQRNLSTSQFIRDDASYTHKSKFPYTAFNIVIPFDIDEEESTLAHLLAELDKYPFVFIQSRRLESYVGQTFESTSDYHIYGVQEYTLDQHFSLEGKVVLTLKLLFFNYLPFCKGFDFLSLDRKKKKKKAPLRSGEAAEYESVNVGQADPGSSNIFSDFFAHEKTERIISATEFSSNKDRSYFSLLSPDIVNDKPSEEEIDSYEHFRATVPASVENTWDKGKEREDFQDVWVRWNPAYVASEMGSSIRTVKHISLTKRNNFARHHLSGWTHEILQYMGKGQASCHIELDLNSGISYDDVDLLNPLTSIRSALNDVDTNYVKYRAYDAYNVLKIECYLLSLMPMFGFALNSENIYASSSEQGKEIYSLDFRESDTRNLMDRSRYKHAGTKNSDIQAEVMVRVIRDIVKDLQELYEDKPPYRNSSEARQRTRDRVTADVVKEILTDSSEQLINILHPEIDSSNDYARESYSIDGTRRIFGPGSETIFDYRLTTLNPESLNDLDRMLRLRVEIPPRSKEQMLRVDKVLQALFYKLLRLHTNAGNRYVAAMSGFADAVRSNYDSIVDDFADEAIDDLKIGDSLGIESGAYERYGITDPRDIPPFLFLRDRKYIDFDGIKNAVTLASFTDDEVTKKINKIASKDNVDVAPLKTVGITHEESDFSKINLSSGEELPEELHGQDPLFASSSNIKSEEDNPNAIDPFDFNNNVIYQSIGMSRNFEAGINQAFPALKVYLVEGDERSSFNRVSLKKHSYYELKGVSELEIITNDDESPVDFLRMQIANPGSVYTDDHVAHVANRSLKIPELIGTSGENAFPLNQMRIRPGNRLHIRAGYGNNINKLETIFNGTITVVGGEANLYVEAEGFGRELEAYEHGDDPTEDNFFLNSDATAIIGEALFSKEIEHFGVLKFNPGRGGEFDPASRKAFSLMSFSSWFQTRLFTNIYVKNIEEQDDTYDGVDLEGFLNIFSGRQTFYQFPIYKSTPNDMLKEMEYRHPGSLSKPVTYGDRHSYFFGIKEQLYIYRDIANEIMQEPGIFGPANTLYREFMNLRYRPVCDYHILTSDHNIIRNDLRVNSDFATVANVRYYGDQDDFEDDGFNYYDMKIDDNLRPAEHRQGNVEMLGTHGKFLAFKYGSVYLTKEMEKMYDGTIQTVGIPRLKAGDYATVNDDHRGISGIIKVRKCSHHFSVNNGYTCNIVPGLYAESSHNTWSELFLKLHMASQLVISSMREQSQILNQSNSHYEEIKFINKYLNASRAVIDSEGPIRGEAIGAGVETGIGVGLTVGTYSTVRAILASKGVLPTKDAGKLNILRNMYDQIHKAGGTVKDLAKNPSAIKTGLQSLLASSRASLSSISGSAQSMVDDLGKTGKAGKIGIVLQKTAGAAGWLTKAGIAVTRFGGPVGWVASVVLGVFTAKLEEIDMTRQPTKYYPLMMNGRPLVGGIHGFKENSYTESLVDEIRSTIEESLYLKDYLSAKWNSL